MKSYLLEDYADGPPVTEKEVRDQAFRVAMDNLMREGLQGPKGLQGSKTGSDNT